MRPSRTLLPSFVVAVAAAVPASLAQDPPCGRCKGAGRLEQLAIDRKAQELEAKVLFCSWHVERDAKTRGLGFRPCDGCDSAASRAAREEFGRRFAEAGAWLEERRRIDVNLKPRDPLIHVDTPHFRLTFGVQRIVLPDRRVLGVHEAAHLYAERLEEFYAWFQELLGYDDGSARVLRHQVFLLDDLKSLVKAATDYAQVVTDRAGRAVGDPSVFVTWRDRGTFKSDAAFHRHVVHHVSHLLQGVFHLKVWLVKSAGWLDEGLAHTCEVDLTGTAGNSCNTETSEEHLADDDWEPAVKKLVLTGRAPSFAELMKKSTDQLDRVEHLLSWSYTDYLLKQDREKVRRLVMALKEGKSSRDALREIFDHTPFSLEESWTAHVRENYRSK